jgi:hypothetical protein
MRNQGSQLWDPDMLFLVVPVTILALHTAALGHIRARSNRSLLGRWPQPRTVVGVRLPRIHRLRDLGALDAFWDGWILAVTASDLRTTSAIRLVG